MGEENSQIVMVFLISTAFIVLIAILLVLFVVIYQKRIVNQEIKLQKLENERQIHLLQATIQGQERERQRLAKDLHDGIGSLLSGLSLHLKFHKEKGFKDSEKSDFLVDACTMVDEGLENVRTVSHNLMPSTLERFGLLTALEECINPINRASNLRVHINVIHKPFRLPQDIALGLLRIFQELIQNTLKHANASIAHITIEYRKNQIKSNYVDDGIGLSSNNGIDNGIGLKNIESRTKSLRGEFTINMDRKMGFEAAIAIPLLQKSIPDETNH